MSASGERAATCRRGGCGRPADPASPGGEWCGEHGAIVAAIAVQASAAPASRAFHRSQ